ncbi:MAG: hypothetical protein ACI9FU_001562 [Granulosicoccus sp.]|jgi:hypothetical protein
MSKLYHLLFTSIARDDLDDVALYDLLIESAENNRQNQLTGLLAYRDGAFLETLEGDRKRVFETYDRIKDDERHIDVTLLELEPIEERQFTGFNMCFESKLEKTLSQSGHYMNYTDAESLLSDIKKPTKGVIEMLTMIC